MHKKAPIIGAFDIVYLKRLSLQRQINLNLL